MRKKANIIGAGIAGLSAGCYLQMNGYDTEIFELHSTPGGLCTSWKRKGFTIDGCIHWLMGAKPGSPYRQLYREVGALEGNRLLPLDHLAQYLDEASGQHIDVTADLDRLAADMKAISPRDEAAIDELLEGVRAFREFELQVDVAAELMGPLDRLAQMWHRRRWLKYLVSYNSPVSVFAARLHSPFLRWVLSNVFTPEAPMLFVLVLLAQLAEGQLASVEGGSLAFALAVARRFQELGGQVVYGALVKEILVEPGRGGDRAVGVRLADVPGSTNGSEHRADAVVSAADGYSTIFEMLGGRYADNRVKKRYETWPQFRPLVVASYGVAHAFPGQPSVCTVRLARPLAVGGREVDALACRVFDDPTLAPKGKTVVQAMFETSFDYWNDLQKEDRTRYEMEKGRVAAQVLDRLEERLPGLSTHVEMTDVATPYTFWHHTRNHRGSYEGWLLTPQHMRKAVPKTLPGLRDFYMAGQWVEPGGGIPSALYSGRQVVQILCHRDAKPFSVSEP